jgi:hypothetical protein
MTDGKIYKVGATVILPYDMDAMLYLAKRGTIGDWIIVNRKLLHAVANKKSTAAAEIVDALIHEAAPASPEDYAAEKQAMVKALFNISSLKEA